MPRTKIPSKGAESRIHLSAGTRVRSYGTTYQIVINPDIDEYLGSRSVQAEDDHGLKAGTVTSITARD